MESGVDRSVDGDHRILFYSSVVFWNSDRWSSAVDRRVHSPAKGKSEYGNLAQMDSLYQEYHPNRQIPVWSYNLILFASFIWCSSITTYVALGVLAYLSQHRFITSKERVTLFSLQSFSFLLQ